MSRTFTISFLRYSLNRPQAESGGAPRSYRQTVTDEATRRGSGLVNQRKLGAWLGPSPGKEIKLMSNKFKIGDKVTIKRVDPRTPLELIDGLRLDHPRAITYIYYDPGTQHNRYYLGSNQRGTLDLTAVHFRASQLKLWVKGRIGRPRAKRRYRVRLVNQQGVLATV